MNPRIIKERALIGLRNDTVRAIKKHQKLTGLNKTQAINELVLTGTGKFSRAMEAWLSRHMQQTGKSREEVLEWLIRQAMDHPDSFSPPERQPVQEELIAA